MGGEFGVGGKFDNGGRFDLRLPYAEQVSYNKLGTSFFSHLCAVFNHACSISTCDCLQGYVDEESENNGNPFSNFFGGGKKKEEAEVQAAKEIPADEEPKKNGFWPF